MLGYLALGLVAFAVISRLVLYPIFYYFYDPKGLRKYPNFAPISGITAYRHSYLSAQGFRSRDLFRTHTARNEPVLRTGPNSLSFHHPQAVKDIYGHTTKCLKDLNYAVAAGSHRHLFDVVDKPDHARKRKQLSAAFAIKNLEKWEHKVITTAERLFRALDSRCTLPMKKGETVPDPADLNVDFYLWINLWTIEAINFITLSERMDLLDRGVDEVTAERLDGTTYRATYGHSQRMSALLQAVFVWDYDLWPWMNWLLGILPTRWQQVHKDGTASEWVFYHQAAKRLRRYQEEQQGDEKTKADSDDFFSVLMSDKQGNPTDVEWGEIVAEVGAIINAGADTTATALTNVLELLIRHPEHLARLRREVDAVLDEDEGEGEEVVIAPYDKVKDLPFLRACIDEALRVIPPTSAPLPRRTPPEGATIAGRWVPGDTSVSMTIYGTHRIPEVFGADAESYDPGRWMDPEERRRLEPFFIPFSTGARGCLGRNISYLEQTVVLASLVHRYEFALPHPGWVGERVEAFNLLPGPMPIKIWRRERE